MPSKRIENDCNYMLGNDWLAVYLCLANVIGIWNLSHGCNMQHTYENWIANYKFEEKMAWNRRNETEKNIAIVERKIKWREWLSALLLGNWKTFKWPLFYSASILHVQQRRMERCKKLFAIAIEIVLDQWKNRFISISQPKHLIEIDKRPHESDAWREIAGSEKRWIDKWWERERNR